MHYVHYKLFQFPNEKIKKIRPQKHIRIQLQIGVPFKSLFGRSCHRLRLLQSTVKSIMRAIENYLQVFFSYGFYNDTHQTESNPNQSAKCQERQKKQNLQRVFFEL